jgi:hypothetical protein
MQSVRHWQLLVAERIAARLGDVSAGASGISPLSGMWTTPVEGPAACPDLLCGGGGASETFSESWQSTPAASPAMPAIEAPAVVADGGTAPNSSPPALARSSPAAVSTAAEAAALATMHALGEQLLSRSHDGNPVLLPSARPAGSPASSPGSGRLVRSALAVPELGDSGWGDELATLAQKMKRVLEEEARRHGIDV